MWEATESVGGVNLSFDQQNIVVQNERTPRPAIAPVLVREIA